jgi:hypothetical protein
MTHVRLATLPIARLRPLGRAADRDYHRLTAYLAEKPGFGPDYSALFAEPVYGRGGDNVDWYWNSPGLDIPVRIDGLGDDERQKAVALLAERLARVREEGERLKAKGDPMADTLLTACNVPEPLAQYGYWARPQTPTAEPTPILVGWGFAAEETTIAPGDILGTRARLDSRANANGTAGPARQAALQTPDGAIANSTEIAAAAGHGTARRLWLLAPVAGWRPEWLLWPIFGALLVAIGLLLVRACALSLPIFGEISFCAGSAIAAQMPDRTQDLRNLLADLQLQLAKREAACIASLPRPEPQPPAPPPPQIATAPPAPPPPPPPLPADKWNNKDLSVLTGCWQLGRETTASLRSSGKQELCKVSAGKICFESNGTGSRELTQTCPSIGRAECKAQITASFGADGNVHTRQPAVQCTKGITWNAEPNFLNCRRVSDDRASCKDGLGYEHEFRRLNE